jgi:arylsulfatase
MYGFRARVELTPGGGDVAEDALPPLFGGFTLSAAVTLAGDRTQGVVAALGDWTNGFALYLLEGRPVAALHVNNDLFRAAAATGLTPGAHLLRLEVTRDKLVLADGATRLAECALTAALPMRWQIGGAGLRVGADRGFPVCDDYRPPFPFTGAIQRVVLESHALAARAPRAELASALRRE